MPTLKELNAEFYGSGGAGITNADGTPAPERSGVGVLFDCPCGCGSWCAIPFANPLDGGPQVGPQGWKRDGDTLETLTLSPSILRLKWNDQQGKEHGCGWHGYIRNGASVNC